MAGQWVWGEYVLQHLRALLTVCPPLIADYRSSHNTSGPALEGVLEWTLPLGFDDGESNVRLTLIDVSSGWGEPARLRVAVAAVAKAFIFMQETVVDLPRFVVDEADELVATKESVDLGSTNSDSYDMATYLLTHVNGDADSLRAEANGCWSFSVIVAEPYKYDLS